MTTSAFRLVPYKPHFHCAVLSASCIVVFLCLMRTMVCKYVGRRGSKSERQTHPKSKGKNEKSPKTYVKSREQRQETWETLESKHAATQRNTWGRLTRHR